MNINDLFQDVEDTNFRTRLQIEFARAEGRWKEREGRAPEPKKVYWEAVYRLFPVMLEYKVTEKEGILDVNIGEYWRRSDEEMSKLETEIGLSPIKHDSTKHYSQHCLSKTWKELFEEVKAVLNEQGVPIELMEKGDHRAIDPYLERLFKAYVILLMRGYDGEADLHFGD